MLSLVKGYHWRYLESDSSYKIDPKFNIVINGLNNLYLVLAGGVGKK